jgi:hypothetical protein
MVHGDQRLFERESKAFGITDSDKQRAGEAGTLGDSDGVDGCIALAGVFQCFANHRNDGAQMLAGSKLGHYTTVRVMGGDLRIDDVGDQLFAGTYNGSGGFVTGAFNAEDESMAHVFYCKV